MEQAAVSQGQLNPKDTVELAAFYNALRPDVHAKGDFDLRREFAREQETLRHGAGSILEGTDFDD
jgi:hypothetical protein